MKFDLHMHSWYSDGSFTPAQVVQKCKEKGLEVISLTDHENVGGIREAENAGGELGIKVISGIEFSVGFQREEHHILGYFVDCHSAKLAEFLKAWRESKVAQIKKIIENLRQFGFEVSFEGVIARSHGSLNRYHIALAMFPDFEKSAEETEKQKAFFKKFLLEKSVGGEGLAFAEREKPDIQSVIDVIHHAGGMAFWAHPFWKIKDMSVIQKLAPIFRKIGLDGIEALYSHHSREQALALHEIANNFSMHESAGSDFHREDGSIRQIANFQTFGIEINFPWR